MAGVRFNCASEDGKDVLGVMKKTIKRINKSFMSLCQKELIRCSASFCPNIGIALCNKSW